MNAWFGNEFDRKNTWFTQIDLFTQYLKRVNFMLQQGSTWPTWHISSARMSQDDRSSRSGSSLGYQFDYINAEVILRDMTVKDGMLTLPHGTQYRVLVLPKLETMRPELLAKIKDLVAAGACILGPAPKRSPSLQNQPEADNQVKQMASELWGDIDGETVKERKFGKGVVMSGLTMEEVFEKIALLPDCKLPEDNSIHYGHRTMAGIEIYFLSNQTDKERIIQPQFRVTGKQPEVWDATSGTIRSLRIEISGEQTTVPLKLAPYESLFVVFRNKAGKSAGNDIALLFLHPTP